MAGAGSISSQRTLTGSHELSPRKAIMGSAMEIEAQGHHISSQNAPHNSIGEGVPHDDVDSFGFSGSLFSTDLLAGIPEEWSDLISREDLMPSNHSSGEDSFEMADQSPSHSRCHSVVSKSQKAKDDIAPCSEGGRSCMVSALKVLQNLHTVPSICFSTRTERTDSAISTRRTTEHVLSTNREASQLISKTLKCSCFNSFQMQLVLATICHKLTAWYRGMLKNSYSLLDGCSQQSSGSDTRITDHADVSEHILHQPITIGDYAIDVSLQPKVRAQVIFGELQHLETFTRNFSSCLDSISDIESERRRSSSSFARPELSKSSAAIHHHLISFLDEQLQAAKADVNAILNGGHEGMNGWR